MKCSEIDVVIKLVTPYVIKFKLYLSGLIFSLNQILQSYKCQFQSFMHNSLLPQNELRLQITQRYSVNFDLQKSNKSQKTRPDLEVREK